MSHTKWVEQVIAKAWADATFKQQLLADPKGAIAQATGTTFAPEVELKVVEETANTLYLVLPSVDSELSIDELDHVVGGWGNPRRPRTSGRGNDNDR